MSLQRSVTSPRVPLATRKQSIAPLDHKAPNNLASAASPLVAQANIQRALADPSRLTPVDVIELQRTVGNRAVARLLDKPAQTRGAVLQPKLQVGPVGDGYEQEAERVAQQVTRGVGAAGAKHATTSARADKVQRFAPPQVGPEGGAVGGDLERRIQFAGGGRPVADSVARAFEQTTGSDVSGVQVINNNKSHTINHELGAKASTHKNKILLGKGQSPNDLQLMSHELTHTMQQGAVAPGVSRDKIQRLSEDDAKPGATVNWGNTNLDTTQITEGMVGGLWAFKEQGDDYTIFVKAEYVKSDRSTSSGQSQVADKLLELVGVKVPVSRVILPGAPEHAALTTRLKPSGGDVRYFKIMADAGGKSLKSLSDPKKMTTEADGLKYLQLFDKNAKLPKQIGKQFIVDAVMGMDDRAYISQPSMMGGNKVEILDANMGNFMVAAGELVAIDNDMPIVSTQSGKSDDFATPKGNRVSENVIDDIMDRRPFLATGLFDAMVAKPVKHLLTSPKIANWVRDNQADIEATFDAGFQEGIQAMAALLQDPNAMQELQTTTQTQESDEEQSSQGGPDPYKSQAQPIMDTFSERGKYFTRRVGGESKDQALTAYTAVKLWSQNPPVDVSIHPGLGDKKISFPKKQTVSNKGKSKKQRAKSNELKKKHRSFVKKDSSPRTNEVKTLSDRITNLQLDGSDSSAKAIFFAKLPILQWDIRQKTNMVNPLLPEIASLGVAFNMDPNIAALATTRRQTLLAARTDFESRRSDFTQMLAEVKQGAQRNKKLGKDIAAYITRLENTLADFNAALTDWDQKWTAMSLQNSGNRNNTGGPTTTTTTTPTRTPKRNTPWKQAKRPSLKRLSPGKMPPLPQLPGQTNNSTSGSESEDLVLSLENFQGSFDDDLGFSLI